MELSKDMVTLMQNAVYSFECSKCSKRLGCDHEKTACADSLNWLGEQEFSVPEDKGSGSVENLRNPRTCLNPPVFLRKVCDFNLK